MNRYLIQLSVVAAMVVAGCADDADTMPSPTLAAGSPTSVSAVEVVESSPPVEPSASVVSAPSTESLATTIEPEVLVTHEPAATSRLDVLAAAPIGADISITAERLTDDRVIRRGGQSEIAQGQTFFVSEDSVLTGVSFTVVAAGRIDTGTRLQLSLFVVADPVSAVPSAHVDLGDRVSPLDLALPEPLPDGEIVHLAFGFHGVDLSGATTYAALLSLGDGATGSELFMQHAESDQYPDGIAIRIEGSTWKTDRVVGDQAVSLTFAD